MAAANPTPALVACLNMTIKAHQNQLESIDALAQEQTDILGALATAIGKLSNDATIRNLALELRSRAEELQNHINSIAESLDCNYKGRSTVDNIFGGAA